MVPVPAEPGPRSRSRQNFSLGRSLLMAEGGVQAPLLWLINVNDITGTLESSPPEGPCRRARTKCNRSWTLHGHGLDDGKESRHVSEQVLFHGVQSSDPAEMGGKVQPTLTLEPYALHTNNSPVYVLDVTRHSSILL